MNAVGSSVLLISNYLFPKSLELDQATSITSAKTQINNHSVFLVDIRNEAGGDIQDFLQLLCRSNTNASILIIYDEHNSAEEVTGLINQFPISKILAQPSELELQEMIQEALDETRSKEQQTELLKLLKSKNEQLKSLYSELEDRVQKRQKELTQSRMKLLMTGHKESTLQDTLLAIYQSRSIGELEARLLATLRESFKIELVRIFFEGQNQLLQQKDRLTETFAFLETPLYLHNDKIGSLFFMRDRDLPFARGEQDFMQKIAEAVALALDRLETQIKSENLNLQWEATFSAISDPVVIVDDQFNVISSNFKHEGPKGKCYELLFQRSSPCLGCRESSRFRIRPNEKGKVFEVSSQEVPFVTEKRKTYVHLYRDITDRLSMEKQILESSKMAELGTIGSSIAHELNNPIGGILTFAQLIKMELADSDPLKAEIALIEDGARRCKDIIQNLLSFTRNPDVDKVEDIDLRDVIHRALKIMELKTRAKGIQVTTELPKDFVTYKGHFNLLSQALQNILQNSFESILEKMREQKGFQGTIKVRLIVESESISISVEDNGIGMSPKVILRAKDLLFTTKDANFNPGLGLAIADRIIKDHAGNLDLNSVQHVKTTVSMRFPRLVLT